MGWSATATVVAALGGSVTGCLVLNEDFGGEGTGGGGGSAGASSTAGPTGGSSGTGSGGLDGDASTAASDPCGPDVFEANDQESAAAVLPGVDISMPVQSIDATFENAAATDWYELQVTADEGGMTATVNLTVTQNLVLCVYVLCDSGVAATDRVCVDGIPAVSPEQMLEGCCGDDGLRMEFECATPMPDARLWVEVTPGAVPPADCAYALGYDL